ncbi:hypothetical protein ACTG9Q_28590 [Actinokineospora sp. 24-640]
MIYRTVVHRRRKGEQRSFAETNYAALLDAAHQQLDGPIVLIWDNLNAHTSHAMRALIATRDWLHVIRRRMHLRRPVGREGRYSMRSPALDATLRLCADPSNA